MNQGYTSDLESKHRDLVEEVEIVNSDISEILMIAEEIRQENDDSILSNFAQKNKPKFVSEISSSFKLVPWKQIDSKETQIEAYNQKADGDLDLPDDDRSLENFFRPINLDNNLD